MRNNKNQFRIVMLLMAIAIIMAVGVFLAMSVVQNRNRAAETDTAVNNFPVTVGTEQISLQVDPNQRPVIVDTQVVDDTPRTEVVSDPQIQEVTATPEATAAPADTTNTETTTETATAVPADIAKIIRIEYVVQQGDTLYSIADRIDTTIALMAEYDIAQGNIVPGQTILLPVGNPAFCAGRGQPYAVREGDTAFSISRRFNTTTSNLQASNNLDENFTVNVADIICVP